MLAWLCSKFFKWGFSSMWIEKFQMYNQVGFRKGRETRDQIANIHWIIKKARAFQKNIYFCFTDYTKAFVYVDHNKLWKILRDWRTRDQLANIHWIIKKAREFQKNIYFCFTDYAKAFDSADHKNWKILKVLGIPNHLTCLLRNLYAGQEATVRTRHGAKD